MSTQEIDNKINALNDEDQIINPYNAGVGKLLLLDQPLDNNMKEIKGTYLGVISRNRQDWVRQKLISYGYKLKPFSYIQLWQIENEPDIVKLVFISEIEKSYEVEAVNVIQLCTLPLDSRSSDEKVMDDDSLLQNILSSIPSQLLAPALGHGRNLAGAPYHARNYFLHKKYLKQSKYLSLGFLPQNKLIELKKKLVKLNSPQDHGYF